MNTTKSTARRAVPTILFYVAAAGAVYLLNIISPSGPCTPGLGILGLLLLPVASSALFVRNMIKVYKGDRANAVSAVLHFVFIAGFIIC